MDPSTWTPAPDPAHASGNLAAILNTHVPVHVYICTCTSPVGQKVGTVVLLKGQIDGYVHVHLE